MPKVSIVMPVYNGEKYLAESIESVLAQTFSDWELLLVNDCSTDSSPAIMRAYVEQDKRIRYYSNPVNLKLPKTLNVGFKHARGDYFTWTSDDNRYKADALAEMVNFLKENASCGLVYCDLDFIDESGHIIRQQSLEPDFLYCDNCIGACFMYRREAVEAVGEYDPDMTLVEDYDYWFRIEKRYPVAHIRKNLYTYRTHSASLTMTRAADVRRQMYRLRLRELDYLLAHTSGAYRENLFLDMWATHRLETWALRDRFFEGGQLPENLLWLEKQRSIEQSLEQSNKKIILFGAGLHGRMALRQYGQARVHCFVDNNEKLVGTDIQGTPIISFAQLKDIFSEYRIIISVSGRVINTLANQLEGAGIDTYEIFSESTV